MYNYYTIRPHHGVAAGPAAHRLVYCYGCLSLRALVYVCVFCEAFIMRYVCVCVCVCVCVRLFV